MEVELKIAVKSAYILKNQSLGYKEIFLNAKQNGYNIIITKDADFSLLVTLIRSATIDHQIKHGKPAY